MRSTWDTDRGMAPTYRRNTGSGSSASPVSQAAEDVQAPGISLRPPPPTLTPLRSSHVEYLRNSGTEQPRRNRSISEATGTVSHPSTTRHSQYPSSTDSNARRLPESSMMAENRLPPLSRLSANIRRSNTISALSPPAPSAQHPHQFSLRFPALHSAGNAIASRSLLSPTRIFSRQFSDIGDSTASSQSSLPPLAPISMSTSTSGLPMMLSPSSSSTSKLASSVERSTSQESSAAPFDAIDSSPRKQAKAHVASACLNCKKAHLACDVSRPCRRCVNLGKVDTCIDVRHKKRGRPRLRERELSLQNAEAKARTVSGAPPKESDMHAEAQQTSQAERRAFVHAPYPEAYRTTEAAVYSQPSYHQNELQMERIAHSHHGRFDHESAMNIHAESELAGRTRSISAADPPTWYRNNIGYSNDARMGQSLQSSMQVNDLDLARHREPIVSFILSTSLHCVRCSEECQPVFGFAPRDLTDISFFELVHPIDEARIERLWTSLIAPVGIRAQAMQIHRNAIMSMSPAGLMMPAAGTVFLREDNIRLRTRSGSYEPFSVRLHLGAGLGADLFRNNTLELAYIVASVVKHTGNTPTKTFDSAVGASGGGGGGGGGGIESDRDHPDPNLLRKATWYGRSDSRQFTSPGVPYSDPSTSNTGQGSTRRASRHANVDVSLSTAPSTLVC